MFFPFFQPRRLAMRPDWFGTTSWHGTPELHEENLKTAG